jgi:F-type H+-transporting ATPase subunit b
MRPGSVPGAFGPVRETAVTDVNDRLVAFAKTLGQHVAETLSKLGKAASAYAQADTPASPDPTAPPHSAALPAAHTGHAPPVWPVLAASAILAAGLAFGLQSSDGSRAAIAEMKEQIAVLKSRFDSIEQSSKASLAALDHRFAAAESVTNSTLAEVKKLAANQPTTRVLAPGETVVTLPNLGPLEQRLALLEEKVNPHAAVSEGAEHGAGTEHAPGAFPPFESANFAPLIIWLALSFGLLYLLMSKIALPRVEGILHARAGKIRDDLKEAHLFRAKSQEAAEANDKKIADAKAAAQAVAQETQTKLNAESEAKRHALEADLNGKLVAAEAQIAQKKAEAMSHVGDIAKEAAAAIVEHITGKPADAKTVAAAVASDKA